MKLIGLAGRARSGKDTVADHLCTRYSMLRYAFARPIKEAIMAMFCLTPAHFEGAAKEAVIPWIGASPRKLMQTLGTEWGRDIICPDLWIRCAHREWEYLQKTSAETFSLVPTGLIITDVRFEDEAAWIRSQGGTVIHIARPDATSVESHKSESGVAMDESDGYILNDGTLAKLYSRAEALVRCL